MSLYSDQGIDEHTKVHSRDTLTGYMKEPHYRYMNGYIYKTYTLYSVAIGNGKSLRFWC